MAAPESGSELRHLDGALRNRSAAHGALDALDASYALFAVGLAPDPATRKTIDQRVRDLLGTLTPWKSAHGYLNFAEKPSDARELFRPDNYRRLKAVKAIYDPSDRFHANQPIV